MTKGNLLDYDDLLLRCAELLRQHPSCVSNVEAVLIDEFQDTNLVQFDLMRLFAAERKRITIVGDPDQSIYGFRSAEIQNLARMRKQYPDTLVVLLEENYRSSGAILLSALEVIEQDESRPKKPLLPSHCVGTPPVLRKLPSAAIEAAWIVSEIKRSMNLTGNLLTYSDFAVLVRSAALSRHIEAAMGKVGIPYHMVGGYRFFDRLEVKILLDYLRVISQPNNNDALARIINVPSRRIGEGTIKALLEEAESKQTNLWKLIRGAVQGHVALKSKLTQPCEKAIGSLINTILTLRKRLFESDSCLSPKDLLDCVIKNLAFKEYIEKSHPQEHEARWANVEELIAQAADTVESENVEDVFLPEVEGLEQQQRCPSMDALSSFLAHVALSTELKEDDDEEPRPKVTISTIHAAKGLEWPVVFIPATYEGSIPHSRAEDTDEERRLLYVAMTRAKALLYMSCPLKNSQHGNQAILRKRKLEKADTITERTTLSPFLSTKSLASHLDCKGPSFTIDVIQSISRILNRACPSETDIIQGYGAMHTTEDDFWPANGEEDPEEDGAAWDSTDGGKSHFTHQRAFKRRRLGVDERMERSLQNPSSPCTSKVTGYSITMQNLTTFSVSSASIHSGFTSAGAHLQDLAQRNPKSVTEIDQNPLPRHRPTAQSATCHKTSIPSIKYRRSEELVKPKNGRGNLLSFFGQPRKSGNISRENAPKQTSPALTIASRRMEKPLELPGGVRPLSQLREPMLPIPQPLAGHGLRSAPIPTRPLNSPQEPDHRGLQYPFFSSSPPSTESFIEAAKVVDGTALHLDRSNKRDHMQTVPHMSDSRPATTFHATTTTQVRCAQTTNRTLGVRRSMIGWTNRGGQPFSVPGRRTGR